MLTLICKHIVPAKDRHLQNWYECNCGEFIILKSSIAKFQQTCGCNRHKARHHRGGMFIHNLSKTDAYKSWIAARKRCNYTKHTAYANYGGRGIKMLFHSFAQFYAELGERPT